MLLSLKEIPIGMSYYNAHTPSSHSKPSWEGPRPACPLQEAFPVYPAFPDLPSLELYYGTLFPEHWLTVVSHIHTGLAHLVQELLYLL